MQRRCAASILLCGSASQVNSAIGRGTQRADRHAACGSDGEPPDANAEGEARARSASEAFLFRRLQTLPETSGRFRLNAELPILFDSNGRMEVDLLCAEAGVVLELDGAQHLADADAYRRDRRKDALLQQNGYFVLRFLAEDAGKRLDQILDAILAALIYREKNKRR